jgi:hypothetical protein
MILMPLAMLLHGCLWMGWSYGKSSGNWWGRIRLRCGSLVLKVSMIELELIMMASGLF